MVSETHLGAGLEMDEKVKTPMSLVEDNSKLQGNRQQVLPQMAFHFWPLLTVSVLTKHRN